MVHCTAGEEYKDAATQVEYLFSLPIASISHSLVLHSFLFSTFIFVCWHSLLFIHSILTTKPTASLFALVPPKFTSIFTYWSGPFLQFRNSFIKTTEVMLYPSFSLVLLATAGLSEARSVHRRHLDRHLARRAAATSDPSTSLTLSPDLVQVGSENNGIDEIGSEAGEAPSSTSTNNFINFCAGQTLTNGLQLINGSCNGIRKYYQANSSVLF